MKQKKSSPSGDITHVYMGSVDYQDESGERETSRPYVVCDSRERIDANQRAYDAFGLILGSFQDDYRDAKIVAVYIEDMVAKGMTVLSISGDNLSNRPRQRKRPESKPRERATVIPFHVVPKT